MLIRTSACALLLTIAIAPQASAQALAAHPYFDPTPPNSRPTPSAQIARGPVAFQNTQQRRVVYAAIPGIEKAVAAQLGNPEKTELLGLRTGLYQNAMVVCGVVESTALDGEKARQRFIARPSVATLETAANTEAFQGGWKSTGCGL